MTLRSAVCLLVLACSIARAAAVDPPERVARLSYVLGSASVQSADAKDAESAAVNWPLTAGDRVHTGPGGRAELDLGTATTWLDETTELLVLRFDPSAIELRLASGAITIELREHGQGDAIRLRLNDVTVDLVQPGIYRMETHDAAFTVRAGAADITAGVARFQQFADERADIANDGTLAITPAPTTDAFERWCAQRAQLSDGSRTAPHVPKGLIGYEDLDANGVWRWERNYGMVWEPRKVSREWTPYRFGQWIWKAPWGWTWVDDAPWGFATAHSGRWAEIDARWVWVPGPRQIPPVYAPALVGWIRDPSEREAMGWYPLAPGEEYDPPYRASPQHARRLNVFTTVRNAPQQAASSTQRRAVTWRSRATFAAELD
jgi:hypothetical protein